MTGTEWLQSLAAKAARADNLVRDASDEPVMRLVERDSRGRFIKPRYDYVYTGR
jgi:hypothetical protein